MKSNLKLAAKAICLSSAVLAATTVSATDQDLLDTLLSNGSITKAQHAKLSDNTDDVAIEEEEEDNNIDTSSFITKADLKAFEWVKKIKITGDMRYRYETQWNQKKKSRHRIRARLGFEARPTDDLRVNIRLATGGAITSTNSTLDDEFKQKSFWLDRAYFDYSPAFAHGVHFIGGKMKQQWYQVSNNVWDSDVNPDGLAIKYAHNVGSAKLTALGGYYLISKQVNGEDAWSSNSDGAQMGHYGLDFAFNIGHSVKWTIGHNGYIFVNTDKYDYGTENDPFSDFEIYEIATKMKIKTGIMPVSLIAQYSGNAAATSGGNAWTLGISTKFKGVKFGYDYRSTEKNALLDVFNDSDFNGGKVGAKGHRVKLSYSFNKYFSLGATYFNAVTIDADKRPLEMVQMDIKAKF